MPCLFMNNLKKTRFYDWSIEEIDKIKKENIKPILGLHVCCAPCALYPILFLKDTFKIVLLYDNSNIYPFSEYQKRKEELEGQIKRLKEEGLDISYVEFLYEEEEYIKDLLPLKEEKEGGKRCFLCYEKRMRECYRYCSEHNFAYFTTVMSISRQKNSEKINEIGAKLEKEFPNTKYFYSDFKKKGGDDYKRILVEKYHLYNQLYCGCRFSYEAYLKKEEHK